jgi:hypothetical protein
VRSYARPKGATPLRVSLVPAYRQCTAPSTTHRGAISAPSCYAPSPESAYLTAGTPDFNGQAANSIGFVLLKAFCSGVADTPPCLANAGDQLDGKLTMNITDVRCAKTGGGCSGPLADYGGDLLFDTTFRITDKNNGPGTGLAANGTVTDLPLRFGVLCATTASTTVGSTCSASTSVDAVLGGDTAVAEQKRAIWQVVGEVKLYDGGGDGVGSTRGDDTLFATSGVFFP